MRHRHPNCVRNRLEHPVVIVVIVAVGKSVRFHLGPERSRRRHQIKDPLTLAAVASQNRQSENRQSGFLAAGRVEGKSGVGRAVLTTLPRVGLERDRTMAVVSDDRLSLETLRQTLRAIEPAALLVEPRILRRVIRLDRRLAGLGLFVPHRKTYTIERDRLFAFVESSELELPPNSDLPRGDPDRQADG